MIIVAKNPLSSTAIDRLLGTDDCHGRPAIHTISCLACVLGHNPTARVLHPSFADFLMDRERCGKDMWYIDRHSHNLGVAVKCLARLEQVLKRNICNLTLDTNEPCGSLPEDIAYACTFWAEHICMVLNDVVSIIGHLDAFLHQHLLHWLEAMSILGRSRELIRLLNDLLEWVKVCFIRIIRLPLV